MAIVVGVGITLLSVIVPARRAAKIPPVAAMRPELGFEALSTRRLVVGTTVAVVGAVMFVLGLFLRPGGALGLIALAGVGALMIFLGVASVSSTVARPVTKAIGWPVAKVLGTPGVLARENAGRAPRRTSATAAALMIGVALVSAAAVFASSLRATFTDVLEDAVQADYIVTDESFQGLPPIVAETLAEVPELSAVTPVRMADAQIEGEQRGVGAADPLAVEQLLNLDVVEGGYQGVADGGVLVNEDSAEDLDLSVGDNVSMTFQNGASSTCPWPGSSPTRRSGSAAGWSRSTRWSRSPIRRPRATSSSSPSSPTASRRSRATPPSRQRWPQFPQAKVQSNAEFREEQTGQIDQLLIIITVLLGFAIAIAVLGISITLALGVFERTREIGLMRAVGMTRRQTRRAVRWEAVIVSTFGAIVGIVVGTLIGVALSLAVPDDVIDRIAFDVRTIVIILDRRRHRRPDRRPLPVRARPAG